MKQNILFALLLAGVLLAGFLSAELISMVAGDSYSEAASVTRDPASAGAVYLSDSGMGFDPMRDILPSDSRTASSKQRSVCTAMAAAMSSYSKASDIEENYAKDLVKSWRLSREGLIYVSRWSYLNSAAEERFMDCIIDPTDLSFIYIRFWAEEQSEPSAKEVNAALDRLGDMTASLPADYKALTSYFDRLYESYYKETEPSGDETEDLLVYPEVDPADRSAATDTMKRRCQMMRKYSAVITDSPLMDYWSFSRGLSAVIMQDMYPSGVENLVFYMMDHSNILATSYTAYDGRIYQTLAFGRKKVTVIFNIAGNYVEGFYDGK